MKNSVSKVIFIVIVILCLDCAVTKLSSIINPDIPNAELSKIMMVAPFSDIGFRKETENAFASKLKRLRQIHRKLDCFGICSIDIIPPFREYTESEVSERMDNAGVDGILVIALEDFWTSQTYVPQSSKTTAELRPYGNSLSYESYTKQSGGYYISKPVVKFELRLFDVKSGEIIWMATSTTSGNAFANYGTLMESLSKSAVDDIRKKGMLKER